LVPDREKFKKRFCEFMLAKVKGVLNTQEIWFPALSVMLENCVEEVFNVYASVVVPESTEVSKLPRSLRRMFA
jgi:hypothetical protein